MKTGKIIEPAFITKLLDAKVVFNQEFSCMADPDLDEKL
jgi:alpha-D-ribose 1-methylphosphonate 5-triphosphate synthase subunit PhnH